MKVVSLSVGSSSKRGIIGGIEPFVETFRIDSIPIRPWNAMTDSHIRDQEALGKESPGSAQGPITPRLFFLSPSKPEGKRNRFPRRL